MPKITELDKKVSGHLDLLISLYFQDVYRQNTKQTLGEFIVSCKAIYPDYFDKWMKEPVEL